MEEGTNGKETIMDKSEIYSKSVRAGKRTYFFDVKTTKGNDYYLTITESKKRFGDDGKFYFEKHKLFLYKEDFEKFSDGLSEVVSHIKTLMPADAPAGAEMEGELVEETVGFSDVNFDDLGKH